MNDERKGILAISAGGWDNEDLVGVAKWNGYLDKGTKVKFVRHYHEVDKQLAKDREQYGELADWIVVSGEMNGDTIYVAIADAPEHWTVS